MTLDEFIDYFENISVDDLDAIGFSFSEMQQVADYLKELKNLRVELEVYKKEVKEIKEKRK